MRLLCWQKSCRSFPSTMSLFVSATNMISLLTLLSRYALITDVICWRSRVFELGLFAPWSIRLLACFLHTVVSPACAGESCDTLYADITRISLPFPSLMSIQLHLPRWSFPEVATLDAHLPDAPMSVPPVFQEVRYVSSMLEPKAVCTYLSFSRFFCLISLYKRGQVVSHYVSIKLYIPASIISRRPMAFDNPTKLACELIPWTFMCWEDIISSTAASRRWRGV